MSDTVERRILGPHHNRLLRVGAHYVDGKPVPGTCSDETADVLIRAEWTIYEGPARAERGWVIAGTDPNVIPRPLMRRK